MPLRCTLERLARESSVRRCLRAAAVLFALAVSLQAQDRWTPELSLTVQSVGGVIPSPDDSLAVYTQTRRVIEEERSEQLTHVWLATANGASRRQLTHGDKSATAPSFSPDSRHVYFLSSRAGQPNIWRIADDGGEAVPVLS